MQRDDTVEQATFKEQVERRAVRDVQTVARKLHEQKGHRAGTLAIRHTKSRKVYEGMGFQFCRILRAPQNMKAQQISPCSFRVEVLTGHFVEKRLMPIQKSAPKFTTK